MGKTREKLNSEMYINDLLNTTDEENKDGKSEVTEFFNGCNILVTGGSGFLGKLLIEKLLRACPNMGNLYLLMRPKKGKTPEERFNELFEDTLFDPLRREQPDFVKHVVMIEGDTGLDNLGLSSASRDLLIENIHVVFHGAATVRFDESLRKVISINVRGTKLMLMFAKEMKHLKSFVHISTAYSHCPLDNIEEKFYKPPMEPDKAIFMIDMCDDDLLEAIKTSVCGAWPNTYAFSKAVGEESVRINGQRLPVCMVRPSIMLSTYKEPLRGWTNNLYGATGVATGAFLCILRVLHCDPQNIAEMIPADYVINNIIVAAWDTAKSWSEKSEQRIIQDVEPRIYNSVSSCQKPLSWNNYRHLNQIFGKEVLSVHVVWYHIFILIKDKWLYNIFVFLLHTIPAYTVDGIAMLIGRKPVLIKVYEKIHKFSAVISYFCTRQWNFDNKNVMSLWDRTNLIDREKFDFNVDSVDWEDFFLYHIRGIRVYLLKDPMSTVEQGMSKYRKITIAHFTVVSILSLLILWFTISFIPARMIV